MTYLIQIIAGVGLLLSAYGFYVEWKVKKDVGYKAVCDLSDRMSCTKTFKSDYGKVFGVPNTILGFLFYLAVIVLAFWGWTDLVFYASVTSFVFSLYLAYILYFRLKNFCLICNGIYLVNIGLVVASYWQMSW